MLYKDAEELVVNDYSDKKNSFNKLVGAMKDGDSMSITHIVDSFPRIKIKPILDKLSRYKYKKYPGYEIAISKLKWRRGW